jgi:group I intron endonuclease
MPSAPLCGIYIIECMANRARYVGQSVNVHRRVKGHHYQMKTGRADNFLLRADCLTYGVSAFAIWIQYVPVQELNELEISTTQFAKSLEHQGGYNKASGSSRAVAARIRQTESNIMRAGNLVMLPGVVGWHRLKETCVRAFCQADTPLHREANGITDVTDFGNVPMILDQDLWRRWV